MNENLNIGPSIPDLSLPLDRRTDPSTITYDGHTYQIEVTDDAIPKGISTGIARSSRSSAASSSTSHVVLSSNVLDPTKQAASSVLQPAPRRLETEPVRMEALMCHTIKKLSSFEREPKPQDIDNVRQLLHYIKTHPMWSSKHAESIARLLERVIQKNIPVAAEDVLFCVPLTKSRAKRILFIAILSGNLSIANHLIETQKLLTKLTPKESLQLLQIACQVNDVELAKDIIMRVGFNVTDRNGNNALHLACRGGSRPIILFALKQAQESDSFFIGLRNLMLSPSGRFNPSSSLDELRASPLGVANKMGFFPLQLGHRNPKIPNFYRLLRLAGIEYPAAPAEDGSRTLDPHYLLNYWACGGKPEEVVRLLMLGVYIEGIDKRDGCTPLMRACVVGNIDVIKALLDAGANKEATYPDGNTILMRASIEGKVDVVKALLDRGANIDTANLQGDTALISAAIQGRQDVIKILLAAGANVARVNRSGTSVLSALLSRPALRETALLEEIRAKDRGLTRGVLASKELAHRYGIDIELTANGYGYGSAGWEELLAVQALHQTVSRYYDGILSEMEDCFIPTAGSPGRRTWDEIYHSLSPIAQERLNNLGYERLRHILSETKDAIADSHPATIEVLDRRLAAGRIIGICTRTTTDRTHCVTMAVARMADGNYRIARCNKGFGSGVRPGILIDTARRIDVGKVYPEIDIAFFQNQMEAAFRFLSSHQQRWIRQKGQKVGNCTVANSNGMELALLVLQLEPLLGYDAAVELAQAIKKGRCEDSRYGTLQAYLSMADQEPSLVSSDLLLAIFCKKFSNSEQGRDAKLAIAKKFAENPQICSDVESKWVKQALIVASAEGYKDMVQGLIAAGANINALIDPNAPGDEDNSPLVSSVQFGRKEIIQILLDAGATMGYTSWELAMDHDDKDVFKMFVTEFLRRHERH